jgi:methyl-accepting chemotaxis protein-1 (serine sensor receptor)
MNNLKISTRLVLLIGTLAALLIAIGALGLYGIKQTNAALKTVYEDRTVPAAQLGDIRYLQMDNRLAINIALITPTAEVIADRTAQVEKNMATISKTWNDYMGTVLTTEEAKLAKQFTEDRKAFVQEGLIPAVAALRANDVKEAQRLVSEKIRPLGTTNEADIEKLVQLQLDVAKSEFTKAEEEYALLRAVSIVAILVGLLFAIVFGFVMVRFLGRQLGAEPGEAATLAQGVADGDLSLPIVLRHGDETSLMSQLKTMHGSLVSVVSNVRQSAENVATASIQIAQGNADLANRTEQQASALEETAASMEELSSTVKQTADNAAQGNQLAMGASTIAVRGGEVVNQVIETMKNINGSSKKIADIISVIDGIAFQTNILALNAAVEAARAGEQGRGFAVVATEVRNLAQRSAAAAKEIKTLITNSVEQVEQGTTLVATAGSTMTEVVTAIRRVTDIMGEISSASNEQSLGVAQVCEAVTQMDQVTQQNAALVEESAAAAESLKAQAEGLVQSVAVFKLSQGTGRILDTAVKVASTGTQKWSGDERRSPDRATNVTRPAFGKTKPVASKPLMPKSAAAPAAATAGASKRTGTDDWTSF